MRRPNLLLILTLISVGCGTFDPDLTDLEGTEAEEGTGSEGPDSSSSSETSTASASSESSSSGDGDGDTTSGEEETSGDGDGDGDTSGGDGDGDTGQPNYCGDGLVGGSEVCDGADGLPLCEGVGEMSCVNACMEINTAGCTNTGLNPALKVPTQGVPCQDLGWATDCESSEVCRLATPDTGICESCVGCLSLNAPCAASSDCDILFTCYAGQCVTMCELGNPACGPQTCTAVGHPTHGVCL